MVVINGRKHYAEEIHKAKSLDFKGWDRYDSWTNAWQWYSVLWNQDTNLVIVEAESTDAPFGANYTKYFNSPSEFAEWATNQGCDQQSLDKLFGNVDENYEAAMAFVNAALAG